MMKNKQVEVLLNTIETYPHDGSAMLERFKRIVREIKKPKEEDKVSKDVMRSWHD